MRTALFTLALCLAAPALAAPVVSDTPQVAAADARPTLELKGGQWFDGARFRPAHWYVVAGKFTARRPARVDATIDLKGRYVLPPLAEAHNHNLQNAWSAKTFGQDYLKRGIFYSVQMAATAADIAPYRDLFGNPGAPDVLFTEAVISASDGHPLALALGFAKQAGIPLKPEDVRDKAYVSIDTAAELDAKWARIAELQPKLIKVILVESEHYAAHRNDPRYFGTNGLDPALLPEIVRRAHALGARVAVHGDTGADFATAVSAGADIVAHLPGYRIDAPLTVADYRVSDASIAEAARRGTLVIPTLAASKYYIAKHPEMRGAVEGNYRDNIVRLRQAGVTLLTGSDVFDGSVIDEIAALDTLQAIPRAELLDMATRITPRALFTGRELGCLKEGCEASLVAYDANPLTDLTALKSPRLLIKQGEMISR